MSFHVLTVFKKAKDAGAACALCRKQKALLYLALNAPLVIFVESWHVKLNVPITFGLVAAMVTVPYAAYTTLLFTEYSVGTFQFVPTGYVPIPV